MGAWDNLELKPREVLGHAENLLTERQSGSFDPGLITAAREQAAKGHLEDVLLDEGSMDEHIDAAGGPDAMLNDIASKSKLDSRLQRGFALAFLTKFAGDDAVIQGGRTAERQDTFQDQLESWARSFGNLAPKVLGYTASTKADTGGGAFAQSYARHTIN